MSDEKPPLQVDTDWKKQAQEEKQRLADEEKAKAAAAAPSGAPAGAGTGVGPASAEAPVGRRPRDLPPASFASLVQSIVTQALFYLGELAPRGGEPVLNLDLAKHHIDTLGVLEEKTAGNLSSDEKRLLDTALYEARMRYVSVASQFVA